MAPTIQRVKVGDILTMLVPLEFHSGHITAKCLVTEVYPRFVKVRYKNMSGKLRTTTFNYAALVMAGYERSGMELCS